MSNKLEIKSAEDGPGKIELSLTGEISIYTVNEIKETLVDNLENFSSIRINVENVSKFDSAGFQLMVLARKEAENSGKQLEFINPCNEFKWLFDLYGMKL